jgi:dihydrofolate reductase
MKGGSGGGSKGIKTYVCSRTLKKISGRKVELAPDAVSLVKRLKSEEGKDIIVMGGSSMGKSLFEAGLVDEFGVNIHPVLLGSGIPLFCEMDRRIDLELLECRQLKSGCVFLNYVVKH